MEKKYKRADELRGKRVFIDGNRGIGDLIVLTPALRQLKSLVPTIHITVGTYEVPSRQAIERLPYVDAVREMRVQGLLQKIRTAWALRKYDYVVLLGYHPVLAQLLHLFGIKHLSGVGKEKHRNLGWFEVMFPHDYDFGLQSMVQIFYERIFQSLGLPVASLDNREADCSLPNNAEKQSAKQKLDSEGVDIDKPYAVIAPEGFTSLSIPYRLLRNMPKLLRDQYGMPCVVIGRSTAAQVEQLQKDNPGLVIANLSGKTSVMEMVAVFQHARIVLAVDSGPMHIATALHVPTVAFFTSDRPERWASQKYCHPVSAKVECSPCKKRGVRYCSQHICEEKVTWNMYEEAIAGAMS